jgi:hypothetical protein
MFLVQFLQTEPLIGNLLQTQQIPRDLPYTLRISTRFYLDRFSNYYKIKWYAIGSDNVGDKHLLSSQTNVQ